MARVSLSEFTHSVDQITTDCLAYRGATLLLGRWTIGAAVGEMNFEGVPDFRPPKGASEHERKDYRQAMTLTSLKPQFSFDAWTEARQELSDFLNEEHRLEQRGYTDQALRDALAGWGEKSLATLGKSIQKIHGYTVEAQKAFDKLSQPDGSGFAETEVQAATFDLALVSKFNGMAAHERAAWLAMLGRPDGEVDLRTVVALCRVPQALTNLATEEQGMTERKKPPPGWKKGQSGNPAGRPRVPVNVAKVRAAIAAQVPALLAKLMAQALEGDTSAARLLLERAIAPLKAAEQPQAVTLPGDTDGPRPRRAGICGRW
jgi:hypothetical protein